MLDVNYIAVFVTTIIIFIIGFFWYSKLLFGNIWMKLVRVPDKQGPLINILYQFITNLVTVYVIAVLFNAIGVDTLKMALLTGFLFWLGFNAMTTMGTVLWERKPMKLWVINNLYSLIFFTVTSLILLYWQ